MVRIRDIALPFDHGGAALAKAIAKKLGIPPAELVNYTVIRKAIDARKKHRILAVYTVDVETDEIIEVRHPDFQFSKYNFQFGTSKTKNGKLKMENQYCPIISRIRTVGYSFVAL